jgi:hypothetical protein
VTETQSLNDIPSCREEASTSSIWCCAAMFPSGTVTLEQQAF